ncbi:MAG: short-chain dehydrogenase/reductase SDR [uncultured bacterium]|nr:MAG: short-chain dehydrogenase/reductase SDR [uncultured bacterium]
MKNFSNKVALVTGAASGIGRATARAFANIGAKVAVVDWNKQQGEETAATIRDQGGDAKFIYADVSKASDVENMVSSAVKHFGRLDYACNNAGIAGAMAPLHEYSEEKWDEVININLKGVWLCMKYEMPAMLKNNSGAIVNIASTFSLTAAPEHYGYVASKHGVIGITKCAALEFIKKGIRVNAICPGGTETAQIEECRRLNPEMIGPILAKHPIGRLADPSEIAKAVIWLCSDESSFAVGSILRMDGGLLAQ